MFEDMTIKFHIEKFFDKINFELWRIKRKLY